MKSAGSVMSGITPLNRLEEKDAQSITSSGMDLSEKTRSASFLQQDKNVLFARSMSKEVQIMGMREALESVPEAKSHYGRAFSLLKRDFPEDTEGGYFIRVFKGREVALPVQACLFLKEQGFKQKVHNLIIVEEGAKLYLITGCSASHSAAEGFHLGISEFFIITECSYLLTY